MKNLFEIGVRLPVMQGGSFAFLAPVMETGTFIRIFSPSN